MRGFVHQSGPNTRVVLQSKILLDQPLLFTRVSTHITMHFNINKSSIGASHTSRPALEDNTGSFIIPVAKYWLITPTFRFLESFFAYCQLTRYNPFDNICLPSFHMVLKRPQHHAINHISKKVAIFVNLENFPNF